MTRPALVVTETPHLTPDEYEAAESMLRLAGETVRVLPLRAMFAAAPPHVIALLYAASRFQVACEAFYAKEQARLAGGTDG